ncbi:MAG: potassium channel family protein [Phycisphaerales bacterium]|jgi:voltage-gated potassium channel|nr:NAD-binding protein [Planctomycetota bacterium]
MPILVHSDPDEDARHHRAMRWRMAYSLVAVAFTVLLAAIGFVLSGPRTRDVVVELPDGLWNALNALTTAGDFSGLSGGQKVWAGVALILGGACLAVTMSSLTSLFVSTSLWNARETRRMKHTLKGLVRHTIVCGYGDLGAAIAARQKARGEEVVVIELDDAAAQAASSAGYLVIEGSAAEEGVLRRASIESAATIVVSMGGHPERICTVMMARGLNRDVLVIATAAAAQGVQWLTVAGADAVLPAPEILANEVERRIAAHAAGAGGKATGHGDLATAEEVAAPTAAPVQDS